jgi:hypothetical protein
MSQFKNLRKLLGAVVVSAATVGGGLTHNASACEPACQYVYVCVTTYEYRTEKYVEWVTEVDHYGCPRRVPVEKYRTVKVPVKKYVKVCRG